MALYKLSIKYQNLHSFKEGLILKFQSILEIRRITHLHGSGHFTIPLNILSILKSNSILKSAKSHIKCSQKQTET